MTKIVTISDSVLQDEEHNTEYSRNLLFRATCLELEQTLNELSKTIKNSRAKRQKKKETK